MNQGKYVFAQIMDFLDNDKFHRIVCKYQGNKGVRDFTCWQSVIFMSISQLS